MKTLQLAGPQSILYQGRALSSAEGLGFAVQPQQIYLALPVLLAAWAVLFLVLTHPMASLALLLAAPIVWSAMARRAPRPATVRI